METKTFTDKLIEQLDKAKIDLEKFQVQMALGKAEAKDKYEEIKKKFNNVVHDIQNKAEKLKEKKTEIQTRLEELQVQLTLGKAETRDAFEAQKKRIINALHNLENSIRTNDITGEIYASFQHEAERFKIKLEILRLNFELGKMDIKEDFEARKTELSKSLDQLKAKIAKKAEGFKKEEKDFQAEIKEAYQHLKKAFT
jgi:hypothetical protein